MKRTRKRCESFPDSKMCKIFSKQNEIVLFSPVYTGTIHTVFKSHLFKIIFIQWQLWKRFSVNGRSKRHDFVFSFENGIVWAEWSEWVDHWSRMQSQLNVVSKLMRFVSNWTKWSADNVVKPVYIRATRMKMTSVH